MTSPGRLQLVGIEPTVLVDAAHNPHGALALSDALGEYFDFDEIAVVIGILADKDVPGIVSALAARATRFHVTQSHSERAIPADELADQIADLTSDETTFRFGDLTEALEAAREWAGQAKRRAVVVAGSITLVGEAVAVASASEWMTQ